MNWNGKTEFGGKKENSFHQAQHNEMFQTPLPGVRSHGFGPQIASL